LGIGLGGKAEVKFQCLRPLVGLFKAAINEQFSPHRDPPCVLAWLPHQGKRGRSIGIAEDKAACRMRLRLNSGAAPKHETGSDGRSYPKRGLELDPGLTTKLERHSVTLRFAQRAQRTRGTPSGWQGAPYLAPSTTHQGQRGAQSRGQLRTIEMKAFRLRSGRRRF